jgi:hypothetical protein
MNSRRHWLIVVLVLAGLFASDRAQPNRLPLATSYSDGRNETRIDPDLDLSDENSFLLLDVGCQVVRRNLATEVPAA